MKVYGIEFELECIGYRELNAPNKKEAQEELEKYLATDGLEFSKLKIVSCKPIKDAW